MFVNWLAMKLADPMADEAMAKMLTEDYVDNPFLMVTVAEKITPRAMIEACVRAETGKEISRPLGSPNVQSPWHQLYLNPRQLFQIPQADYLKINTETVIGPLAKRPLKLSKPILITGMSYGGSLALPIKMALAKGATLAGTATNTGESGLADEERQNAQYLIGQYNRGGWMTQPDQLGQLDAIEVQLGQGAWGGAVDEPMAADQIGDHLRYVLRLPDGEATGVKARMPGINSPEGIVKLVNELKAVYDVPVGIKIAGTDFMEDELEIIAQTQADYIVVDGAEGGTASSNPTLEDDLGLPTLYALARTVDWLIEEKQRDRFSVIATGGLTTPGHFLKALALGADAVYIGTIALVAAMQTQMAKVLPQAPPPQLALYQGKMAEELDIDQAAKHLANFLESCTLEMKLAVQAVGKSSLNDLNRQDLVAMDKDLAQFLGIRYAGSKRTNHSSN